MFLHRSKPNLTIFDTTAINKPCRLSPFYTSTTSILDFVSPSIIISPTLHPPSFFNITSVTLTKDSLIAHNKHEQSVCMPALPTDFIAKVAAAEIIPGLITLGQGKHFTRSPLPFKVARNEKNNHDYCQSNYS